MNITMDPPPDVICVACKSSDEVVFEHVFLIEVGEPDAFTSDGIYQHVEFYCTDCAEAYNNG